MLVYCGSIAPLQNDEYKFDCDTSLVHDDADVLFGGEEYMFELGKDELPEGVEDIRGKIYDEPSRVFASCHPGWVRYFGLLELSDEALLRHAYKRFQETQIEEAIVRSTQASWEGGYYAVELFKGGTFRVLWSGQIGNLYNTPGLMIAIAPLGEDEWSDEGFHYYDNAIAFTNALFEEALKEDYGL